MRDADAAAAVERTLFMWPEIPGLIAHLRIPGVTGRVAAVDSPRLNCVGLSRLGPRDANETIDAVRRTYAEARVRGAWLVDPTSTPRDLPERLTAHGWHHHGELSGLVLDDLSVEIPADSPCHIREVSPNEAPASADLVARGLELPAETARVFVRAACRPGERARPARPQRSCKPALRPQHRSSRASGSVRSAGSVFSSCRLAGTLSGARIADCRSAAFR